MADKIYTLGYESAAIEDFIATLKAAGIERVIDVREYPLSRRKGYSKNVLHALLNANDIEYVHLKGLGDPKEGREAARAGDYKKFMQIFSKHMKTKPALDDLQTAIALATSSVSCLLCYERSPDECHRTIVAEAIVADTGQRVMPIGVREGIARKQQAARDICPECGELGHTSCYNAGYQAAQAALMPVLVEARDAIIEARRNIDEVDNALADSFMWDALARLNSCIGEK